MSVIHSAFVAVCVNLKLNYTKIKRNPRDEVNWSVQAIHEERNCLNFRLSSWVVTNEFYGSSTLMRDDFITVDGNWS